MNFALTEAENAALLRELDSIIEAIGFHCRPAF
jgi:hypothetical protein